MSLIRKHTRLLMVAVCCVAAGAGAGVIAGAGAATRASGAKARTTKKGGLRRIAMRSVHGDFVVHTPAGFRTVTIDRGVVDSVSGQQLKITEGTPKASYKTVTLTIASDARIRDDKQKKTSLSSVKAGQRVLVLTAPRRTLVIAH